MPYAVKTQDAIRHVLSKQERGRVFDSYQITDLIRKAFGKQEKCQTVGRQLRRMTNEEGIFYPWLNRVGENQYIFVDNPISLYSLLDKIDKKNATLKDASDQELIAELKKRLKR